MILNHVIEIKTKGCRKLPYYESLGYDTSGDSLLIKVIHLNKGSREPIDVICDFCNKEVNITYKEYLRNISIGGKYACCKICGSEKAKETNLKAIGVQHPMKLKEVQEKSKKTLLKKYGVEYLQQSSEIKEKSKKTLLKKYGVDHISKSDHFKDSVVKTNLKNLGVEYPMQSEVVKEKSKKTLMSNYGVDNPSKSIKIRSRIIENNQDRYGVDYPSELEIIKYKTRESNMLKYGVDNPSKLNYVKDKLVSTNIQKYGVPCSLQSILVKSKSRESIIEKYGVDNVFKSMDIINKIKSTNIDRYGFEYPMQSEEIKDKYRRSNVIKYGSNNILQNEKFRKKFIVCGSDNYIEYLKDGMSLFKCDLGMDHNFEIFADNFHTRSKSSLPLCTICFPIDDKKSIKEVMLLDFIKSIYTGDAVSGYRDGLEIDIYLPDLKIGFEFNGLYWHSDEFKNKNYHINKTNYFRDRGIRIIHIWEDDWINKQDIVKSQIANLVFCNKKKIFARKCEVVELEDVDLVRDFINNNHIQGYVNSVKKFGLYHNSELLSVMTFDKFEGRKKMEISGWNLSRFCTKLNTNVVGGASKILSHFIKQESPGRIISYADKDWSVGDLYKNIGFDVVGENGPDYKYLINGVRSHKSKYRRSSLNTDLSESAQMRMNGINKIWDCGKTKFEMVLSIV